MNPGRLPWADMKQAVGLKAKPPGPEERLNVRNGICLSCLHDAAFDCHLISFDEELRLVLSPG